MPLARSSAAISAPPPTAPVRSHGKIDRSYDLYDDDDDGGGGGGGGVNNNSDEEPPPPHHHHHHHHHHHLVYNVLLYNP